MAKDDLSRELGGIEEWRKTVDKHREECEKDREELKTWKTQQETIQAQAKRNRIAGVVSIGMVLSVVVVTLLVLLPFMVLLLGNEQDAQVIFRALIKLLQSAL